MKRGEEEDLKLKVKLREIEYAVLNLEHPSWRRQGIRELQGVSEAECNLVSFSASYETKYLGT